MSAEIAELNDKNFKSMIKKDKWVVDFWAEWCIPCKIMAPYFDAAAKELKGKVNFGKINVDDNYETAQEYGVMSIPTTIFFSDGEIVNQRVGAMTSKEQIKDFVEENN